VTRRVLWTIGHRRSRPYLPPRTRALLRVARDAMVAVVCALIVVALCFFLSLPEVPQ
jgi:hypothetical protein